MPQNCQKPEVSAQTLGRWWQQFRGMGDDEIKRMRQLEEENRRLRKAVADPTLDKQILTQIAEGKHEARPGGARRWRACGSCIPKSRSVARADWSRSTESEDAPSDARRPLRHNLLTALSANRFRQRLAFGFGRAMCLPQRQRSPRHEAR
ncbi:MAG: transposase [Phycisphaerales bacterium]